MRRPILLALALAFVAALGPGPATAQGIDRTERIAFAPGAESATVEDRITGREVVDYLVRAGAGQPANISLASAGSVFFNLIPPGAEQWEAVFVGSRDGSQYEGVLDRSGDWTVRLYQMGQAADGGLTSNFRLEVAVAATGGGQGSAMAGVPAAPADGGPRRFEVVGVSEALNMRERPSTSAAVVARLPLGAILGNLGCAPAEGRIWCDVQPFEGGPRGYAAAEFLAPAPGAQGSAAPYGEDDSALRAGRGEFDATAPHTACSRGDAPLRDACEASVARGGGGDATVVVRFPDGVERILFFTHGAFMGTDASEASGGFDTDWSKDSQGIYRIRIEDERYAFPEALVFGG